MTIFENKVFKSRKKKKAQVEKMSKLKRVISIILSIAIIIAITTIIEDICLKISSITSFVYSILVLNKLKEARISLTSFN